MRIIFLLLLSFLPCALVHAQDAYGEQILSFDVALTVQSDSSVKVVETIAYDFGENERRGIYREIPYKYKARGGNFSLKISDVSVRDTKRRIPETKITRSDGHVRIRIGDEDVYITGRETYIISYTVDRAINFFDAHDELYWNVTGDQWDVPILSSSALVRLGQSPGRSNGLLKQDCFVGVFGSTENCDGTSDVEGFFQSRELLPGEGLTIVAGFSKGLIVKPQPHDLFTNFLRDNLIIFLPFVSIFFMGMYWYRRGRDPKITGTDSIVAQWEIPQVAGRALRPYEMGIVVDEFSNKKDFSSLFIDLAIRGYFTIEKIDKKWVLGKEDYRLTKVKDWSGDVSLERFERTFLNGVFGSAEVMDKIVQRYESIVKQDDGQTLGLLDRIKVSGKIVQQMQDMEDIPVAYEQEIVLSSLRNTFHKKYSDIVREGYTSVLVKKLFVKNPQEVRALYFFGAVIAVAVIFLFLNSLITAFLGWIAFLSIIASVIVVGLFGFIMPRKTMEGVRAHHQILGLKKYLEAAEKRPIAAMQGPDMKGQKSSEIFEKYLPYAMVLGVEKEWAKQFEGIYDSRESTWFRDGNTTDFSAGGMSTMTKGFAVAAGVAALSKPASASGGGSGFSGGGSGGGGGGGGGGSW